MENPLNLLDQSSRDNSGYSATINKMIRSGANLHLHPLTQLSSENLQNKQTPVTETLPLAETLPTEDERGRHTSDSVLEILKENGLSGMLDKDEATTLISKRPKKGKMYSTLETNINTILNEIRMREDYDGAVVEDFVDMGNEIADAVSVLRILAKSTNEIESVGELAQKSAMVLQAAFALQNKGTMLLWECISKLRTMNFDQ